MGSCSGPWGHNSRNSVKMIVDYSIVGLLEWILILTLFVIIYFRISMLIPTGISWGKYKNIKILTWDVMSTSFDVLIQRFDFWWFYLTCCDYSLRLFLNNWTQDLRIVMVKADLVYREESETAVLDFIKSEYCDLLVNFLLI